MSTLGVWGLRITPSPRRGTGPLPRAPPREGPEMSPTSAEVLPSRTPAPLSFRTTEVRSQGTDISPPYLHSLVVDTDAYCFYRGLCKTRKILLYWCDRLFREKRGGCLHPLQDPSGPDRDPPRPPRRHLSYPPTSGIETGPSQSGDVEQT